MRLDALHLPATRRARLALVALLAIGIAWLAVAMSLVPILSKSTRLASVFMSDDGGNASGVVRMLTGHSLDYHHYFYPGLYFNLSAILAWIGVHLGLAVPRAALLATRTLSAIGGGATIVLTGLLTRRLTGRWAPAILAAMVMATVPKFFSFAIVAHPDTLQTALMLAALWPLFAYVEDPRPRRLVLAAGLAGLAMATKYAGAFLVPGIAAAVLVVALERRQDRGVAAEVGAKGSLAAAAFAGAFLLAHPRFLVDPGVYLTAIRKQAAWHAFGHLFHASRGPLTWVAVLGGRALVGSVVTGAFFLAVAGLALHWWRQRGVEGATSRHFPWAATASVAVLYLAFLLWGMRDFAPRFLFPCVPFVVAVGVGGLCSAAGALRARRWRIAALAAVVVAIGVTAAVRVPALAKVAARRRRAPSSPALAVGRWLDAKVPQDTRILYDAYTYVPQRFHRAVTTWGLRPRELRTHRPQMIVTNAVIRRRFADAGRASSCRLGATVFLVIHRTYAQLAAGRLDGFRPVARFQAGHVRVYARGPLAARLAPPAAAPAATGSPAQARKAPPPTGHRP